MMFQVGVLKLHHFKDSKEGGLCETYVNEDHFDLVAPDNKMRTRASS